MNVKKRQTKTENRSCQFIFFQFSTAWRLTIIIKYIQIYFYFIYKKDILSFSLESQACDLITI